VGVLYVGSNVDLEPLIAGGTGSRSEELEMPEHYPDKLEAGTLPGPAIVALAAGVNWLEKTGVNNVRRHESRLAERFLEWSADCDQVEVYGGGPGARRTSIVAFQVRNVTADRVADILDRDYGIAVRSGLHCASQAHRALGTLETGLVRASFGYFNRLEEVDELCRALENIATTARK
jgi:selenocysteine lyase/cysteine desulfurase